MKDYISKRMLRTSGGLEITIYECRPEQFTLNTWDKYISLTQEINLEFDPDSPPTNGEQLKKMMLDPSGEYEIIRWLAFQSGTDELLGKCVVDYPNSISPLYEDSRYTADISVDVDKEYRRKGVARDLLKVAAEKLLPLGRGNVQIIISMPSGREFFRAMGARIISERAVNRLYMKEVDWGLMDNWVASGRAVEEGVKLELHDSYIPEADLKEFCSVYTACGISVPDYQDGYVAAEQISPETRRASEKRWKKHGIRCLTMFSREPSGAISGLTECYYLKVNPHIVEQDLTGVLVPYRNRGIGKWLKAEMILYLRKEYPKVRFLETGNSNDNGSMMAINTAMGYRKFRDQCLAKVDLENLPAE